MISNERLCSEHQQPAVRRCGWCGKSMCGQCIKESKSDKYCSRCAEKVGSSKRQRARIVRNVDEGFTEEQIKEAKDLITKKEKRPRIRNVPDGWED